MSTKLVRAALALLCAVAVLFGTALFPGALGVEFESSGPLDSRASEPVTPDGTAPDEDDSGPTPVPTSGGAETTPSASDDPAATATPTPTETATETPAASEGEDSESAVLVKLFGLALIGGFGVVAVGVIRAASNSGRDGSTDAGLRLHPLLDKLAGTVVSAVSSGAIGQTVSRIPKVTTAVLLSGSSAFSRVGAGISAVSGGILTGLTTGIGSVGAMSLRGVTGLPSALGSLSVAPFKALSGFSGTGGFLASVRSGVDRPSLFGSSDAESRQSTAAESTAEADDSPDIDSLSVQEAWALLAERVSVSDPETATPGEYGRRAIDSGLPAEPVRRLTVLFREVEYGGRSATSDRIESARNALRQLLGGGDD